MGQLYRWFLEMLTPPTHPAGLDVYFIYSNHSATTTLGNTRQTLTHTITTTTENDFKQHKIKQTKAIQCEVKIMVVAQLRATLSLYLINKEGR